MSGVSTAAKDCCIKDSVLVRGTSCVNAHYKRYCSHVEQQPRPPLHATAQAAEHVGRHPCITICKAYPQPDERQHAITTTHSSIVGLLNHVLHFVFKESCDGFSFLSRSFHMVLENYLRNRKYGEWHNVYKPMTRNSS